MNNGCTASSYAVNANCAIGVAFAPLGTGSRSATITLTDDASNSPQTINVGGNASPAITVAPASGGSTSAAISAGQTAVFNLQITAGPGYTGTVSFAYSGAPLGANIQAPSTLQLLNGNAASLSVMVTTSGAAAEPPYSAPRTVPPPALRTLPPLCALVLLLLLLALIRKRDSTHRPWRAGAGYVFATLAVLLVLSASGCGGGSTNVTPAPPPQIVTPKGTFTIVVTPSATSVNGQPLQLQPIPLTLTVR
jgi:hypothetical protein